MDALFTLLTPGSFAAACAVTLIAGFVKGAVGFAMPLIMVSGMALFLPPEVALAGLILPIVMSNGLQTARYGWRAAVEAVRDHIRYVIVVCVMIALSAQTLKLIPSDTMYLVLGVPVVVLSAVQLAGLRFRIPPERRALADWLIGGASGVLGGLAGTWGPPTVLYLLALETPKQRQMVVQGVIYGLGSVTLLGAHIASGVLNAATVPLSAALLVPAFLGMQVGFRLGALFNQEVFRRVTLVVLILTGLNLVRRGLMG